VEDAPRILETAEQRFPFLEGIAERVRAATGGEGPIDLSGILDLAGSATTMVLGSLTVLVLTIYFTIRLPRMRASVASLLHPEDRQEFEGILEESIQRVGGYVLGNLAISAIAGVTTFIALLLIGVPFAAALAFFTAIMDLIPTVGALIAALVATIVAAFVGVPQLIATAAFFLVYQQVENYLIQPRVMRRAIDMSAPMVILAVLIGGTLLGVIGALLALPVAAIIKVAFRELYLEDRREEVRSLG
jgi:predicted PurR-regulated permease PerM